MRRATQVIYRMISFVFCIPTLVMSSSIPNNNNNNVYQSIPRKPPTINSIADDQPYYEELDFDDNRQRNYPTEQSFEERIQQWREFQQQKQREQTPLQQASSTDDQGRLKLIASVSKGSIAFFFFLLMWRSLSHYELADNLPFKGLTRLVFVVPSVFLFLSNLLGAFTASGFSGISRDYSSQHKKKVLLKKILNYNKMIEIVLFAYNVLRLTVFTSKTMIREVYVGRTISNFLFLVQLQLFTKVTWDGLKMSDGLSSGSSAAGTMPSYPTNYDRNGGSYGYENNDYYNMQDFNDYNSEQQ